MHDLHCHLLPGIDDGPPSIEAAVAQARAQVAAGVSDVVCTPHVSHAHRNDAAGIGAAVEALRAELERAGVPLAVHAGAEVSLARAIELDAQELDALRLGGSDVLLLEPPLASEVPRLRELVRGLATPQRRVLVAHPERCASFHRDPGLLRSLVDDGALVQLTAASLSGGFGRTVRALALDMVSARLVHVIASDAHDVVRRPPGLAGELEAAGVGWLTDWACEQVPRALLSGAPLPARPSGPVPSAQRRGLLDRLRGRG